MRVSAKFFATGYASAFALVTEQLLAAPPWVNRHLTLPGGNWAFDAGLGFGHLPRDPAPDVSGMGVNAEMAVGITDRVEFGVRTGIRVGDDSEREIRADQYGRLFDRQTFDTGAEVLANPELRVRGALVRAHVAEVALEGRVVLPFENGTVGALLFGVPLAFHLGDRVRLDTGAYVPVFFARPTAYADVRLPLDVWIQVSWRVWLGPMTGIVLERPGATGSRALASLGFGFGYEITHYLDFKAMVLFPNLSDEPRIFGGGAGVEIRIE
jgi:hypothetical protein